MKYQDSASKSAAASDRSATASKKSRTKYQNPDAVRETIESLVVAFILAFLFRTFEAEAFVIPTGSMAETLNGRHKEVDCTQCGWHYHIGASQEVFEDSNQLVPFGRYHSSVCPNCQFENAVADVPVFHGDRILVNKFSYELGDPKRWDVIVFKFPEQPQRNYIKRLVGLPGEILKIERGDLYVRNSEKSAWSILRKDDPEKQKLLQMIVYNNDHPERLLLEHNWPERWAAAANDVDNQNDDGRTLDREGWTADAAARSFSLSMERSSSGGPRWIRYRHFLPTHDHWSAVLSNPELPFEEQPYQRLVSDICGYNAASKDIPYAPDFERRDQYSDRRDQYWVGDLTLNAEIDVTEVGAGSAILLELTEGVRDYRCRIDLQSGRATLTLFDRVFQTEKEIDAADTAFVGKGSHRVTFANVDNRLCLWIDGQIILFPNRGNYDSPTATIPTRRDLAPAAIGGEKVAATVKHLVLERDIYYRADQSIPGEVYDDPEYHTSRRNDPDEQRTAVSLDKLLKDPEEYGRAYLQHARPAVFPQLADDHFFVLGDNSPQSNDSRLWTRTNSVPRHALLGKAFFIYWPHGVPFLNDGKGYPLSYHQQVGQQGTPEKVEDYPNLRFPFYPNVGRMERIR